MSNNDTISLIQFQYIVEEELRILGSERAMITLNRSRKVHVDMKELYWSKEHTLPLPYS